MLADASQGTARWLEWDATVLQPATLTAGQAGGLDAFKDAVTALAKALQGQQWLGAGGAMSVADVAVYGTLLPVLKGAVPAAEPVLAQAPGLQQWAERCAASGAWQTASEQVIRLNHALRTQHAVKRQP